MPLRRPRALSAQARVHLFAPSSPFDHARFWAGHALIAARYQPNLGDAVLSRQGFLAGSDRARCDDLLSGLNDPAIGALIAARGGYGATRLLPQLDVQHIAQTAKWLVGFSDITALHALWARAGLCSIHGPMVCSLPDASPELQAAWFALLEGAAPAPLSGLTGLCGGNAEGRLFGGNLTVLTALLGTPFMPPLDDVVLLLEDVAERPYRLDRMLTTLLQSGCLDKIRAVILGQFTECIAGPDGTLCTEVLVERLSTLGVPLLANAPFGHIHDNTPLLLGAHAVVDAKAGRIVFDPA